jgi:hypothetical protein
MQRDLAAPALAAALLLASPPFPASSSQSPSAPVVAVWYRGVPAGTPRADDLGAIKALGFTAIAWTRADARALESVKKLAAGVGLTVVESGAPAYLTAESALTPGERVDVRTDGVMSALAWRAFAHGARTIVFDAVAPAGAGLETPGRELQPWVNEARNVSRQITVNARLASALRPAPGVVVWPDQSPDLDVVLLDADRSWALIATNASRTPRKASVRLPAGAPYAIWISWLDGSPLSMLGEAPGPRWDLDIAPGAARAYLIDKVTKSP